MGKYRRRSRIRGLGDYSADGLEALRRKGTKK